MTVNRNTAALPAAVLPTNVASAAEKVQQIAHAVWLQSTSLVWNTAYKGIDDWQLALRQAEAKEKAA